MRTAIISTILLAAIVAAGCIYSHSVKTNQLSRYESTRDMMGTFVTITLYAESEEQAEDAGSAAYAHISKIEALMSVHRADSEITEINNNAYEHPVNVSSEVFEVLQQSIEYGKKTNGAFDVTVSPYIKLWKSAARSGILPGDDAIKSVSPSVGYENLELNEDNRTVRFLQPSMKINLGGIAKGYAVDKALATLRQQGITAALVNAGGDIATMGSPPGADHWRIKIQKPNDRSSQLPELITLTTGAVATSGDYERFVRIGGKKFSHIIDPRTGRPVEHMSSVTVVAPNATRADAMATACSVLGPVEGLNLAAKLAETEVMYVTANDDGPGIIQSHEFGDFLGE